MHYQCSHVNATLRYTVAPSRHSASPPDHLVFFSNTTQSFAFITEHIDLPFVLKCFQVHIAQRDCFPVHKHLAAQSATIPDGFIKLDCFLKLCWRVIAQRSPFVI